MYWKLIENIYFLDLNWGIPIIISNDFFYHFLIPLLFFLFPLCILLWSLVTELSPDTGVAPGVPTISFLSMSCDISISDGLGVWAFLEYSCFPDPEIYKFISKEVKNPKSQIMLGICTKLQFILVCFFNLQYLKGRFQRRISAQRIQMPAFSFLLLHCLHP